MTDLLGGVAGGAGALLGGVADTATSTVNAAVSYLVRPGDTLAGIADAHGVPLSAVLDANPDLAHVDAPLAGTEVSVPLGGEAAGDAPAASTPSGSAGAADSQAVAGGFSPPADAPASGSPASFGSTADAGAGAAPASAGPLGVAFAGAAEWRLLAQATPSALLTTLEDSSGSVADLLADALEAGTGRLPPELQAPSAGRLAQALQLFGWSAVAATAGRPGDVAILMLSDGLHAVRLGADGLPMRAAPSVGLRTEGASGIGLDAPETEAALVRAPGQPPGIDVAAPQTRTRRPSEREDESRANGRPARSRAAVEPPPRAWVARVLPAAMSVKARWGVPAGATVAHGALISDWGRHAPGNDFFGVLVRRSAGGSATPVRAPGRALVPGGYPSLEDAADHFGADLRGDARLAPAFRHRHAAEFVRALASVGFGGPRYSDRMDALIALNGLAALD